MLSASGTFEESRKVKNPKIVTFFRVSYQPANRCCIGIDLPNERGCASGYIDTASNTGRIELLAVDEKCRNKGLGKHLISRLLSELYGRGAHKVELQAFSYEDPGILALDKLVKWYQKRGGRLIHKGIDVAELEFKINDRERAK